MILRGEPLESPFPLRDLLDRGLTLTPDREALIGPMRSWTWRQLDHATTSLSRNYRQLGLKPGDRIASLLPDDPMTILHYLACLKAGLVITTLHYRSPVPFIDHVLAETEASALVFHAEREAEIKLLSEAGRFRDCMIRYAHPHVEELSLETMIEGPSEELPREDFPPSLDALIIYTSGSTGAPKGVVHTRETLGWIISSLQQSYRLSHGDRYLGTSPTSFSIGTKYNVAVLAAGACAVVGRASDFDEILMLLRRWRPTFFSMVSPTCLRFLNHVQPTAGDFASLRIFAVSGDHASQKLKKAYSTLTGTSLREAFGMTEISAAIITPDRSVPLDAIGTVAAGYELAVRDQDGRILPAHQTGELTFRSKTIMARYWKRPDATAHVIKDGWLYTGDVVFYDEDGFVYFKGRSKQLIVHDAVNISPQEVEEALLEHGAVTGAAVVGSVDPLHGEAVWAFVTVDTAAEPPGERDLIRFAQDRIGWRAPEHVVLVASLPTTPTGKLDRTKVKEMWSDYHHDLDC